MSDAPLFGFEWNEIALDRARERGIFTIVAATRDGRYVPVGTGFVLRATGPFALAASAAHVFSHIRALQKSSPRTSHPSALFLPPDKPVDLDLGKVTAVFADGDSAQFARIIALAFDERTDVAVLQLQDQHGPTGRPFDAEVLLHDRLPEVGSLVGVVAYADLDSEARADGLSSLTRRPVCRVGRVLAVHPDGTRLCRGPCIETSIPVYSGMSGGIAALYTPDKPARAFGFVCSDPDEDTIAKQDRSIAGRSLIAKLPCTAIEPLPDNKHLAKFEFIPSSVSGTFVTLQADGTVQE